jgi:hypothetical protein
MKTGKDVKDSGLYMSECCNEELELLTDAMFPRCPRCLSLTAWELVTLLQEEKAA